MTQNKRRNLCIRRRPANKVRDIQSIEIAWFDIAVNGVEIDVIGVHVPWFIPTGLPHRNLGRGLYARGLGAYNQVLAIGFVPDRSNLDTPFRSQLKSTQLRSCLMREAVAHA